MVPLAVALAVLALPAAALDDCVSAEVWTKNGACDASRPVPVIEATPAAPRAGKPVTLAADSFGRGVTYAWDLDGDGAFDDAAGAGATATLAPGENRVSVRATDAEGRVGVAARTLHTHAANLLPDASWVLEPARPAAGQPVRLVVEGTDVDGTVARLDFDLDGDGDFEVHQIVGDPFFERPVTFPAAGVRTLGLRVVDDDGGARVLSRTVDVHPANLAPEVAMIAPDVARPGRPITLRALASDVDGAITSLVYDRDTPAAPDGTVQRTFSAPGTQLVSVRATDSGGASTVYRRTIEVRATNHPPAVTLSRLPGSHLFSALAADADSGPTLRYAWDTDDDGVFDDATGPTESAVRLPTGFGERTVAVRVTDGEGATATDRLTATLADYPPDAPALAVTPHQPRAGEPVTISLGALDVAKVEWDVDGVETQTTGATTTVTFPGAGPRAVQARLTDTSGRTAVGRTVVNVSPATGPLAPALEIGGSVGRAGVPADLFASSGFATYAWDTDADGDYDDGDQAFVSVALPAGEHEIAVRGTEATGATFTQRRRFTVHAENRPPEIAIGNGQTLRLETGRNVDLTAELAAGDDPITAWAWDTDGDGAYDDGTATTVTVGAATPRTVTVRLRATDLGGAQGFATLRVIVSAPVANEPPLVTFTPALFPYAAGVPVRMTALGTDADAEPLTYAWDADGDGVYDDGTTSTLDHVFAQPGVYDVSVKVSDGHSERTATRTAMVTDPRGPAIESFGFPAAVRVGRPTPFTVSAADPDASLTFDLDGDGTFDDAPTRSPYTWTFPTADPVTVAVKATNAAGRSSVRMAQVTPASENTPPAASILGPVTADVGRPLTLYGPASDPDGTARRAWDLDGDGQFDDASGALVSTTSLVTGPRTVALRVTDDDGATATATFAFTVGSRAPVARFAASDDTPAVGQPLTFTSLSYDPDGRPIVAADWDLDGDGAFDDASGPVAQTAFAEGAHRVGLKVRDTTGELSIRYVRYAAAPEPIATATPALTAAPRPAASPPAADTRAPTVRTSIVATKLEALLRRGLKLRITCSEACTLTVTASVSSATARKLELARTVGRVTSRRSGTVVLKLTSRARKALARQRSVKLVLSIVAADLAGNRATTARTVKVSR